MPGFDGTGPRGQGPLTGRGLGYCVEPIGTTGYGYTKLNAPYSDNYRLHPGPLSTPPYISYASSVVPSYRVPFQGVRGRRSWARGRFFGPGRGFRRR